MHIVQHFCGYGAFGLAAIVKRTLLLWMPKQECISTQVFTTSKIETTNFVVFWMKMLPLVELRQMVQISSSGNDAISSVNWRCMVVIGQQKRITHMICGFDPQRENCRFNGFEITRLNLATGVLVCPLFYAAFNQTICDIKSQKEGLCSHNWSKGSKCFFSPSFISTGKIIQHKCSAQGFLQRALELHKSSGKLKHSLTNKILRLAAVVGAQCTGLRRAEWG